MDTVEDTLQNSPLSNPVHTFTPQSHQNLLISHLQLDFEKENKLQNEIRKATDENERLRKSLDRAIKDMQDKDIQLAKLNNELKNRNKVSDTECSLPLLQGKPIVNSDLQDKIINHFNGILQHQHNILNEKDKKILDLQKALEKPTVKTSDKKAVETQVSLKNSEEELNKKLMDELTSQVERLRKERKPLGKALSEGNDKLETSINEFKQAFHQYSLEILRLRKDLQAGKYEPLNETIMKPTDDNYNEQTQGIVYLREVLSRQGFEQDKLADEIREIIQKKQNTVDHINDLIRRLNRNSPQQNDELEKECQTINQSLNVLNSKLDDLETNLKSVPVGETGKKDKTPVKEKQTVQHPQQSKIPWKKHPCCHESKNVEQLPLGENEENILKVHNIDPASPAENEIVVKCEHFWAKPRYKTVKVGLAKSKTLHTDNEESNTDS